MSLPAGPDAPRDLNEFVVLKALDLFRFSDESLPHRDVSPGGNPYFSLDGGMTKLANFTTGLHNGDGDDPSHWQLGVGIMDAEFARNAIVEISAADLRAFDVIGWDVVASVPEPITHPWWSLAFVVLGCLQRVRRTGIVGPI